MQLIILLNRNFNCAIYTRVLSCYHDSQYSVTVFVVRYRPCVTLRPFHTRALCDQISSLLVMSSLIDLMLLVSLILWIYGYIQLIFHSTTHSLIV